jgi:serine/threonine-protein kinase RsbW
MSRPHAITIGADSQEARRASQWLESTCRDLAVPREEIDRLALCLEEVLANIISHGGEAARSEPVRVQLEVEPQDGDCAARVTVSDAGTAFDPLSAPMAPAPRTLSEALPRGMGLGIIRQCSLGYQRQGGRNHLTFGATWKEGVHRL